MRPAYLPPLGRASPHAAAAPLAPPLRCPPLRGLPPIRAALPRRYAGPSLRCASLGDSRPRFGHGPAADAAGRGLRRGRLSSPLARLRVELARGALARLRLGRCPRRPRGPVPFGQSGPREDRRGSSRRSAALFRPAGFGWGRARECGTRQLAASPTPPPIRAQATPSLTRVVQIRRGRRISNAACPSAPSKAIFWSKSVAFGPMEAPATQFCPKNGLQRRCKAACNSPRVSRYA